MESNKKATVPFDLRMMQINSQRTVMTIILAVLLIAQTFVFYNLTPTANRVSENINEIEAIKTEVSEAFVSETVRAQMRLMLNNTRQTWAQYLLAHPETELLQKEDGLYVYGNEDSTRVVFDPATMEERTNTDAAYFDIYNKEDGALLAERVRPLWNEDTLNEIIKIVASPLRAYGTDGFAMVFDSYTGEIFLENSGADFVQKGGAEKNILTINDLPECQNKNASTVFSTIMMVRKDSDRNSNYTDLFYEPRIQNQTDASNFEKYPLGQYERRFVEKVILPYEGIGIEGQDMQISIMIEASEQNIFAAYTDTNKLLLEREASIVSELSKMLIFPMISVGLSLVVIFFSMFMIRLISYQCRRCHTENGKSSL